MAFAPVFQRPFAATFDRRAAAAALAPPPVAGMAAWWKADALSLSNGDAVTTWADSSSGGHDVTQATAGAKPTYLSNQLNGQPAVSFDGGDYLAAADTGMPTGNLSVFTVAKSNVVYSVNNFGSVLHYGKAAAGKSFFATFGEDINFGVDAFGVSQYGSGKGIENSCQAWYTFSTLRSEEVYTVRRGATSASKVMTTGTETYGAGGLAVGSFNTTLSWASKLNGLIAEIIVYNSALSDTDRGTVETYLNAKYAL